MRARRYCEDGGEEDVCLLVIRDFDFVVIWGIVWMDGLGKSEVVDTPFHVDVQITC